jgi:hypothetical protein
MRGPFLLLAADVGEFVIWALIALASFVVWVYNQIKKANEEQMKAPPPAQEATPPPPRRRPAQADAPPRRQQPPVRGQTRAPKPRTIAATQDEWEKSEDVATHVRKHLDAQEFERRTGSMGQLAELDDTVDEHVEQVFDHRLGTLVDQGVTTEADSTGAVTTEPGVAVVAAAGIAEVLADPASLRNAIILQEILRPPQWE